MSLFTYTQPSVRSALEKVRSYGSLEPTDQFNNAVNTLVETIIALPQKDIRRLPDALCVEVRELVSSLESAREAAWARKIFTSSAPKEALQEFPYLENYNRIIAREVGLIEASGLSLAAGYRMLAIGSGPLPLTALQFYARTGVLVDQLDSHGPSLELGRQVSRALQLPGEYIHDAAERVTLPASKYDVVFVAVLAGGSHGEKQSIVDNVLPSLKDKGRLLLRSAKGARGVIYPVVDASLLKGVRLLAEAHPNDIVINSSLVFEKE